MMIESKVTLGLGGVMIVLLSVAASIGNDSYVVMIVLLSVAASICNDSYVVMIVLLSVAASLGNDSSTIRSSIYR